MGILPSCFLSFSGCLSLFSRIYDHLLQMRALQSLVSFKGQNNRFTGPIPVSISELSNLEEIDLGKNLLTGTLPSPLGSMNSLTSLILGDNRLIGTIPSELGNLQRLVKFDVSKNEFTGSLPSSLAQAMSLELFDTSGTSISGLESLFCTQEDMTVVLKADCSGDNATTCTCCSTCCADGENCIPILPVICETRAAVYESYTTRGTSCSCLQNSTVLSCEDTCESCNLDGTVCAKSAQYGKTFDEATGEAISFQNTLQYTLGPSETLTFSHLKDAIDCEVYVNGEKCTTCAFTTCQSGLAGYEISCKNIGGPDINTCHNEQSDAGYLEVFYLTDPSLLSGCLPVLSDHLG